jgi:hypothetical protein
MTRLRARRAFWLTTLGVVSIGVAVLIGCSSDNPPGEDIGGSSSSGGIDGGNGQNDALAAHDGSIGDGNPAQTEAAASDGPNNDAPPFTCLDDKPMPDGGANAPTACPSSATCTAYCDHVHEHFKLGVAQVAIECLLKLPSCAQTTDVRNCIDGAIAQACPDPTSPGYCGNLVLPCDPNAGQAGSTIDEAGCEDFANAMTSSGRSTLATCLQSKIDAGTCATDNGVCVGEIRQ